MMSPFDSRGVGSRLGVRAGTRNFGSSLQEPPAHAVPTWGRVTSPEASPIPDVVARPDHVALRTRLQVRRTDDPGSRGTSSRRVATEAVLRFPQTDGTAAPSRLTNLLAKPVVVGERRSPGFGPGDPRLGALAAALLQVPSIFKTNEVAPLVAKLLKRSPMDYRVSHFRYDFAKLRARNLAQRIGKTRRYRLTRMGRLVCMVIDRRRRANHLADVRSVLSYQRRVASA